MNERYLTWGVLLSSALAIFMVNIDITIVNVALPSLVTTFSTSFGGISLVTLSYLVSVTAFLLLSGKLSDIIGPELVLRYGYGIFILGSLCCGLSQSLDEMVVFRFIQGIGASMLFAASAPVIIRYIPENWTGRAYGINGLFACIGFALGSPLGGYIQEIAGWSWIFFVNIPIGIGGIVLTLLILTRPYPRRFPVSIDRMGAVLSLVLLVSLTYTLHSLTDLTNHLRFPISFLVTAISFFLFIWHERRTADPLLDCAIFHDRTLNLALIAFFFYMIILSGTSFLFPFYFITICGMSATMAGIFLAIPSALSIVLAYVSGWLSDRIGPRIPCSIGLLFCLLAGLGFVGFNETSSLYEIIGSLVVFGLGIGLFVPASVAFIMNQATRDNSGTISGVKSLVSQIGGIIGISVFTLIMSAGIPVLDVTNRSHLDSVATQFSIAMGFVCISALLGLFTCIAAKPRIIINNNNHLEGMK